jgi:hypothetical protein
VHSISRYGQIAKCVIIITCKFVRNNEHMQRCSTRHIDLFGEGEGVGISVHSPRNLPLDTEYGSQSKRENDRCSIYRRITFSG